ncbi:phosphopantothenoylcysteine decarboxylase-like [Mercenaria mercenaria]|uniref:phosphopantothenoylcysteine decarboxylase-like n=1 Tax=Mercenaria mercenaria TaxID=6596 RepID=UPI001E1D5153|nr:phosphopantothenoylcysteine decarboxylase-like [Mercenaria mercenaria]
MDNKKINVLICCTGSVAALKIPEIVARLLQEKIEVKVVTTDRALHFFDSSTLSIPVLTDADEWKAWTKRGDPVLHIDLRKWADILVIAPLDANTLAKISNGICDNLLTCVVRAWDLKKPLFFAPAMNTYMWEHPLTYEQIEKLESWGYREIPVVEKTLVCGDKGAGAMAEVSTIVEIILEERGRLVTDR